MSTTHATTDRTETGRHPVRIGHLVMGLLYLCLVAGWALAQIDVVSSHDIRWLLPIPWLLAGTAGLAALTVNNRSRARRDSPEHYPHTDTTEEIR